MHLVYPHGNTISTPNSIGRELGRRLETRYTVVYHGWSDRDLIHPEPGDVLLGHPHPRRNTVFRRSAQLNGWRRRIMLAPFSHADLRNVAFEVQIVPRCDLFLAMTGPYWFGAIEDSACSHWRPKMIQLDLAVDRSDFPPLKASFGAPGKRRVVYIGNSDAYKNTPYLSEIAALLPDTEFAWIGSGVRPIPGLTALGRLDFSSHAGRDLAAGFDFLLTVGKADPNPTTILEAMAWGLIPICTPTSGYEGIPSIPNVPLGDAPAAASVLGRLLQADESDLASMQAANWQLLDGHYNWDRFAAQVVDAIESSESPPLLRESPRRRLLFTFYNLASAHGPIAQRQPGRALFGLLARWADLRATRATRVTRATRAPKSGRPSASDGSPGIVSVVVYCDGREGPLARTLESLASQTLAEFEILLVGTPPSREELDTIAPELAATDGRPVSLRPLPGPLSTAARNEAIGAARGRFVIELSAGDWIDSTALEKAAWALETTPQAGLVVIDEARTSQRHPYFGPVGLVGLAGLAGGGIQPGKYVLRLAAWRGSGGFEVSAPAGAADQDLLIRLVGRRWQAEMIPERLADLHAPEAAGGAASRRWLLSRHRRFYARAAAAGMLGGAAARIRPRIPFLVPLTRWINWKVQVEGLADRRRALRHPLDSALRFVPQPLKGRLWRRLKLPVRPPMWSYEPPQLDLPDGSLLRPTPPPEPKSGKAPKTRLLVAHHYLTTGGASEVVLNLLSGIDRNRFDVHLITTDYEPDRELKEPPLRRFAEQTAGLYQLPQFLDKEYFLRFLIDFINSRRIDVVLISLSIFTYQALPQLRAACPDTAFLDLLHAEAPYGPMDHIRLASRYRRFLDRRVVTTETVRSAQIAKYGETADRVLVIPNGIDTANTFNPNIGARGAFRRELGIGADVAIVLYYGRMSLEKQPMQVVDVAERLRDRSDIAFVLLGEGPETSAVGKAISARRLPNVHLVRPRDDLRSAVADADLMMFPSMREGLPMAGIESMSMGKPIVASMVPGWVDLVTDGVEGFLIADGDIAGYADAITRLLGDPVLYERMSRAGREKATRAYDRSDSVREWERLLGGIVSDGRVN